MSIGILSCARRATARPLVNSRAAASLPAWLSRTWPRKVIHKGDGQQLLKAVVAGEVPVAYLPHQGLALVEQFARVGVIAADCRQVAQNGQDGCVENHPPLFRWSAGTAAGSARRPSAPGPDLRWR